MSVWNAGPSMPSRRWAPGRMVGASLMVSVALAFAAPAVAQAATGYKSVSAGYYYTCALKADNSITCWGLQADAPAGSYKSVSSGGYHTCAVKADDSIV